MGLLLNPLNGELEMGQVASQVPFDNTIFESNGVSPATNVQEASDSFIVAMVAAVGSVYATIPTDHDQLLGLADDDHTQYALLAGRSGGQTLYGGTGLTDSLTLYANDETYDGNVTYTGKIDLMSPLRYNPTFTASTVFEAPFFNTVKHIGWDYSPTITLSASANAGGPIAVKSSQTVKYSSSQIITSAPTFQALGVIQPTAAVTDNALVVWAGFQAADQYRPSLATAITATTVNFTGFTASPSVAIQSGSHASAAAVVTNLTAFDGFASALPAVASQATVTNARNFHAKNPVKTGTGAITNNIGLDIDALTAGGTLNIGVRIAPPTGTGAQAISITGTPTTASGGITWGTDTNLYRSATNTLKTDDNFTSLGSQIFGAAGTNTDLKKFGNTTGDEFYVGTNAAMRIQRSAGSSEAFGAQINGDTARRVLINSSGVISFGDGSAAQDTNIYRSAADTLKTDDKLHVVGELELDGALNHDGTTVGFYGTAPATQSTGWSATNVTTDKSFDANATTLDELADVVGTLIDTLKTVGIIGA